MRRIVYRLTTVVVLAGLLACLLGLGTSAAPALPAQTPEKFNLKDYAAGQFAETHFPGMSIEIVDKDGVRFGEAYGEVAGLDTPMIIGSLSKSVTASAIMQLVESGEIDLSDPIARHLPQADQQSTTTVHQLLTHTSGIATNDTLDGYRTSDSPAPFEYANVNYSLLGQIIQNVSGQDYGTYLREHIAEPLAMTHTFTSLSEARVNGLTPGHQNYFGAMVRASVPYPSSLETGWGTVPAGYLISSANDMGRYLQMLLGTRPDVLSADSIARMMEPAVRLDSGEDGDAYGMGLRLKQRLVQRPGEESSTQTWVFHAGNVQNYTTYMILVPARGIAAIAMFDGADSLVANSMAEQLTQNVVNRFLGNPAADLGSGAYVSLHAGIDTACAVIVLIALVPLFRLPRWAARGNGRIRTRTVIGSLGLHLLAPTLILAALPLSGSPLWLVRSFVPDVFATVLVAASLLYAGGVAKLALVWWARARKGPVQRGLAGPLVDRDPGSLQQPG